MKLFKSPFAKPVAAQPPAAKPAKSRPSTPKPPTAAASLAKPQAIPGAAGKAGGKAPDAKPQIARQVTARSLTDGQRAYEEKRAAKAGMSLDKWLGSKQRQQEAEAKAKLKAAEAAKPHKPPGLFSRLLERAQRPLGS